jgi:protease IV
MNSPVPAVPPIPPIAPGPNKKASATVFRFFSGFWSWLDFSRRAVFNLIFLFIVIALIVAIFSSDKLKLQDKTALVLNLSGPVVEQQSGSLRDRITSQAAGGETSAQTQLRDVLMVLDAAAKDKKIDRVLLLLDDFSNTGLANLREVAAALERFKASGKQVVAWGSNFDQKQYYLAAHASEVMLHPMGMAYIDGFGRYRNYYRDALDKVGVTAHVIRVGTYKNFGEPYFANAPSKATMESDAFLYDALWKTYTDGVEAARKLPVGSIVKTINELPQQFAAAGNNAAKLALQNKLVDSLKTRDEMRQMMIERGAKDETHPEQKTFRQVSFYNYLDSIKPKVPFGISDAVGVVVAEGEITDGAAPAGAIGGRSTAELIRRAREDEKIKAIVLRVNSPGGSAFGSELVRHELELTRTAGKPVVVSMGNVAASGGYWISMAADEVIADEATITGSIGVFAILPTAEKALEKLSVNTGGYTTTWLGGGYDPRRALDPRFEQLIQGSINNIYSEFTTKAAAARKTTPDKIDAVAQGRVWTGAQAKERGLIDRTGSFTDAIKSAAAKAKLPEDVRVTYIEPELSKIERILQQFGVDATSSIGSLAAQFNLRLIPVGIPNGAINEAQKDLLWLSEMADKSKSGMPFMALTHCLCGR